MDHRLPRRRVGATSITILTLKGVRVKHELQEPEKIQSPTPCFPLPRRSAMLFKQRLIAGGGGIGITEKGGSVASPLLLEDTSPLSASRLWKKIKSPGGEEDRGEAECTEQT